MTSLSLLSALIGSAFAEEPKEEPKTEEQSEANNEDSSEEMKFSIDTRFLAGGMGSPLQENSSLPVGLNFTNLNLQNGHFRFHSNNRFLLESGEKKEGTDKRDPSTLKIASKFLIEAFHGQRFRSALWVQPLVQVSEGSVQKWTTENYVGATWTPINSRYISYVQLFPLVVDGDPSKTSGVFEIGYGNILSEITNNQLTIGGFLWAKAGIDHPNPDESTPLGLNNALVILDINANYNLPELAKGHVKPSLFVNTRYQYNPLSEDGFILGTGGIRFRAQ